MRRAILAGLAAVSLVAAADGMYKWVDEKGVTHYSESPPPDDPTGKKATKLDIKPNGPSGPSKEFDWKAKELDSRTQNVQKVQEQREQEAKDAKEALHRKQLCNEALRQVNIYQQAIPVYTLNDKGERVYVEDADREKKIEDGRERMRKYCD
ncbi:MAG: DUF4124 domain-containing protein [Usitatibacter sp.]